MGLPTALIRVVLAMVVMVIFAVVVTQARPALEAKAYRGPRAVNG